MICYTVTTFLDVIVICRNPFAPPGRLTRYFHLFALLGALATVPITLSLFDDFYGDQGMSYESAMWKVDQKVNDIIGTENIILVVVACLTAVLVSAELATGLHYSKFSRGRVIRQQMLMAVGFGISDLARAIFHLQSDSYQKENTAAISLLKWLTMFYDVQIWLIVTHSYCRIFSSAFGSCRNQQKAEDIRNTVAVTDLKEFWQYNADADGHDIGSEMRHELVLLTALGIFTCGGGVLNDSSSEQPPSGAYSPTSGSGWGDNVTVKGTSTTGGLRPEIKFPGVEGKILDFYDYSSVTFGKIRKCLGLTPKDFQEAFREIVQFLERDDGSQHFETAMFKEILSSGASGSYFYFSPNRKFIVKQVSSGEKETLQDMSEDYLKHCEANPNTGIHYYGLYAIRLPMCTSKKMYFVVMKNFLYTKPEAGLTINLTFDLKGATTNRQRLKSHSSIEAVRRGGKGSSLLDWEWMNLSLEMDIDKTAKRMLSASMRNDLKFLAEQRLLDYSILLGVTVNHRENVPAYLQRARLVQILSTPEESMVASKADSEGGLEMDEAAARKAPGVVAGEADGAAAREADGATGEADGAAAGKADGAAAGEVECAAAGEVDGAAAGEVDGVAGEVDGAAAGEAQAADAESGAFAPSESAGDALETIEVPLEVIGSEAPLSLDKPLACLEQPFRSMSTGELAYCVGMIDILEQWNSGWWSQGWVLKCVLKVFSCFGNPRGITAIDPVDYALRFDEFFHDQIMRQEQVYDDWKHKDGPTWRPWK